MMMLLMCHMPFYLAYAIIGQAILGILLFNNKAFHCADDLLGADGPPLAIRVDFCMETSRATKFFLINNDLLFWSTDAEQFYERFRTFNLTSGMISNEYQAFRLLPPKTPPEVKFVWAFQFDPSGLENCFKTSEAEAISSATEGSLDRYCRRKRVLAGTIVARLSNSDLFFLGYQNGLFSERQDDEIHFLEFQALVKHLDKFGLTSSVTFDQTRNHYISTHFGLLNHICVTYSVWPKTNVTIPMPLLKNLLNADAFRTQCLITARRQYGSVIDHDGQLYGVDGTAGMVDRFRLDKTLTQVRLLGTETDRKFFNCYLNSSIVRSQALALEALSAASKPQQPPPPPPPLAHQKATKSVAERDIAESNQRSIWSLESFWTSLWWIVAVFLLVMLAISVVNFCQDQTPTFWGSWRIQSRRKPPPPQPKPPRPSRAVGGGRKKSENKSKRLPPAPPPLTGFQQNKLQTRLFNTNMDHRGVSSIMKYENASGGGEKNMKTIKSILRNSTVNANTTLLSDLNREQQKPDDENHRILPGDQTEMATKPMYGFLSKPTSRFSAMIKEFLMKKRKTNGDNDEDTGADLELGATASTRRRQRKKSRRTINRQHQRRHRHRRSHRKRISTHTSFEMSSVLEDGFTTETNGPETSSSSTSTEDDTSMGGEMISTTTPNNQQQPLTMTTTTTTGISSNLVYTSPSSPVDFDRPPPGPRPPTPVVAPLPPVTPATRKRPRSSLVADNRMLRRRHTVSAPLSSSKIKSKLDDDDDGHYEISPTSLSYLSTREECYMDTDTTMNHQSELSLPMTYEEHQEQLNKITDIMRGLYAEMSPTPNDHGDDDGGDDDDDDGPKERETQQGDSNNHLPLADQADIVFKPKTASKAGRQLPFCIPPP